MFTPSTRTRRTLVVGAMAAGLLGLAPLATASASTDAPTPVALSLQNGWKSAQIKYSTGLPTAALDANGIVHLAGGILGGGSGTLAFTLPAGDAPSTYQYINTYTFDGSQGSLTVYPDGSVLANGTGANGYVDLAGIQFAAATNSLHWAYPATTNGWTSAQGTYSTGDPAVALDSEGVVHLAGSVLGGSNGTTAFVLPQHNRPTNTLYINMYTLNGSQGELKILKDGEVQVYGASASGYASLAGVSFRAYNSLLQSKALSLQNGWVYGGFGGQTPSVSRDRFNVVHLAGGLANTADNNAPFVLPKADWPAHITYETIYTYNGAVGSIVIYPDGSVLLYGQPSGTTPPTTDEQYTSLDGITFSARG